MNKKQADRFATLYWFVKERVPGSHFDMGMLASKTEDMYTCGGIGCLAGWCPVVFPEEWHYRCDDPILTEDPFKIWDTSFQKFFGLTYYETRGLTCSAFYENVSGLAAKREALARMIQVADSYGWVIV